MFFFILAWEPSFAWKLIFSTIHSNYKNFKPSQEHSRGSPEFPNQNLRQIGQEGPLIVMIGRTNEHTYF